MKTVRLLQALSQQLNDLRAQAAPLARHATVGARFDRHLFQTRSTLISACLEEAERNLTALRHAVERAQLAQVAWLAEHLSAQIAAIMRETATWSLRAWDSPSPAVAKWQRKRLEHQEFERRLLAMKAAREARLRDVAQLAEQQNLQREVMALEGRLARCRHALERIESVLARLTR
nr:primosomal replication protein N'' [uncultured Enterobacter sp.]